MVYCDVGKHEKQKLDVKFEIIKSVWRGLIFSEHSLIVVVVVY